MDSPSSPPQPDSKPQPDLKPRSFFQSGCFITIVIILLVLTVGLVIFYFGVWRVPTRGEEVRKVREQAEARLDAAKTIPEKENGWFTILEAAGKVQMNVMDSQGNPVELNPIYEKGVNAGNARLYEKFVIANTEAVDLVEKAMKKKECVPVWDFRKVSSGLFPMESIKMRDLIHLLILMGDEEAKKGNCEQAAGRYMQALLIGDTAARAESSNTLLYGSIMSGEVSAHLRTFLNEYPCNSQTCEYVTRQMFKFEKKLPSFRQTMECELINNHYTLNQTRINIVQGSRMQPHEEIFLKREYVILDSRILEILNVEKYDYPTALDKIDTQSKNIPLFSTAPQIMISSYDRCFRHYTRNRVERRGLLILAALHRYREDTGHYPDSLSQLVPKYLPELPIDNYSQNRQFHYIKTTNSKNKAEGMKKGTDREDNGETILLYSIGDDLKDDGGKNFSRFSGDPGDIVFTGKNPGE